jgi:hypothetical protein
LVDIQQQVPQLGYDPEETHTGPKEKALVGIEFIPLDQVDRFTTIDIQYFILLLEECKHLGLIFPWYEGMNLLVNMRTKEG